LCYNQSLNSDGTLTTGSSWTSFYTLSELQGIKNLGFDSVRLCFRGDPLVTAKYNNDNVTYTSLVNGLISFGKLCISAGLYVNFDFHPTGSYGPNKILASNSTSAPYFVAYVQAISGLAAAIASSFVPETVALELLNEPNPPTAYWANTLQPVAFAACRAVARHLTMIVKGEGDAMANLPNINVGAYDWNTIYSVHTYDYWYFTYGGTTEQGPVLSYFSQVDYPPDGLDYNPALTRTTANINADNNLSASTKTSYINTAQYYLWNYYSFFTKASLLTTNLPIMNNWALSNNIDRTQLYIGETGAAQSGSSNSTTVQSRASWYSDVTGFYNKNNIRWGIFAADIPSWVNPMVTASFHICDPTISTGGAICNSSNVPPLIKTALGLT
jgi:hypothetical protein